MSINGEKVIFSGKFSFVEYKNIYTFLGEILLETLLS